MKQLISVVVLLAFILPTYVSANSQVFYAKIVWADHGATCYETITAPNIKDIHYTERRLGDDYLFQYPAHKGTEHCVLANKASKITMTKLEIRTVISSPGDKRFVTSNPLITSSWDLNSCQWGGPTFEVTHENNEVTLVVTNTALRPISTTINSAIIPVPVEPFEGEVFEVNLRGYAEVRIETGETCATISWDFSRILERREDEDSLR